MFHIGYTQFRSEKKTLMQELKTPSESTEQAVRAVYDSVADSLTHISDSLCSYFILQFWNELLLLIPSSSSFPSPATKNTYLDHTLSICLSLSAFNDRNNFSKTLFLSLLSALPSLIQQPQFYDTLLCRLTSYSALNSNLPVLLQLLFKHASSLTSRYAVLTCILDNAYSARAKGGWLTLLRDVFTTTPQNQMLLVKHFVTQAQPELEPLFITSQQRLRQKGFLLLVASLPVSLLPLSHA